MGDRLLYLFNKLTNLDDDEKQYLLVVINEIINKQSELTEIEKKLLIKYSIMDKCLYYNYPIIDVVFVDENDIPSDKKEAGGWYDEDTNKIYITPKTLRDGFSNEANYHFTQSIQIV